MLEKSSRLRKLGYRWDGELNWKDTQGEKLMRERIEQLIAEEGPRP